MNLTTLSSGIHKLKKDHIYRKDYTFSLKKYLEENKIVFLEGDSDSGKTTICQEFCFENMSNTISIFFNPLNKIDYNIDYFMENVISQLRLYLDYSFQDSSADENLGIENFPRLLIKLRKKQKERVYIL